MCPLPLAHPPHGGDELIMRASVLASAEPSRGAGRSSVTFCMLNLRKEY
jgi:hypothetical protein